MRRRDPNSRFARGMRQDAARNKAINKAKAKNDPEPLDLDELERVADAAVEHRGSFEYHKHFDPPTVKLLIARVRELDLLGNAAFKNCLELKDERDQLKARVANLEDELFRFENTPPTWAEIDNLHADLEAKTEQCEAQKRIVETYQSESKEKERKWSAGVDINISATPDDANEWAYAADQILQRFDEALEAKPETDNV